MYRAFRLVKTLRLFSDKLKIFGEAPPTSLNSALLFMNECEIDILLCVDFQFLKHVCFVKQISPRINFNYIPIVSRFLPFVRG